MLDFADCVSVYATLTYAHIYIYKMSYISTIPSLSEFPAETSAEAAASKSPLVASESAPADTLMQSYAHNMT